MRARRRVTALAVAAALTAVPATIATAHPDGGGGREQFPGEGVADGQKQHGGVAGHLPAVQENVTVVGKGGVTNPSGAGTTGRVADVFAYGDYAYLAAFRDPTCVQTGVHVMDISDLTNPTEVTDAFIPTSPGSYVGEGVQVIEIGGRDVLIHQNETCPGVTPGAGTSGGINLWDVTDPENAVNLAMHVGDTDGGSRANSVHSMYAWNDENTGRTYVVLVDNEELADVDIMDITDPTSPVMVNDTLDLVEAFGVDQASPSNLTSLFSHDMTVVKNGSKYVMNVNYWDGGYVLLDVTDPTPGNVKLIAESDYAALDEERAARGHAISPEGNAHQSELSPDRRFLIGTDEDFNPYRVTATIDSGPYTGTEYVAVQASDTPPIDEDTSITGNPTYVGRACTAVPAGDGTALIERGDCTFQTKLNNVRAAGYDAGIVFNNAGGCDGLLTMLAAGDIPFVFVSRTTGLQLLQSGSLACTTPTPAAGSPVAATTIEAVFDGWGYVRLFKTDVPRTPKQTTGSITQVDTYAVEESQSSAYATGFGDLSVHEVAMDPNERLAYLSYYAAGFRVVKYGDKGLQEVGAFIDEGGNNFWGVEVYERDGQTYVLASDRDLGLYVLQYTP
ncbi:MAG: PA domain-containing protein [Actinomycetes bacterium]